MYLTFAWRYFKAKKNAQAINIIAWVTVGVIAFATACQILVLSVFNGFEGLVKSLYASFYADLKIIPAKGKTFILSGEQISAISKLKNISSISMVVEEKALLQNDQSQTIVTLKGVDSNYAVTSGVVSKTNPGKFDIGNLEKPGIVVGAGIQNAAGINIGDGPIYPSIVTLILPKKRKILVNDPMQSLSEGNATATGVFSIQQEFDSKYAITNIDFVKQQIGLGSDEYSAAEIKVNNPLQLEDEQKIVQAILGAGFLVQTKYEQNSSLYSTMKLEKWVIYAVLTLILVIAAFNMISALTMLVLEKQRDISVLQSMGANQSMVLKIFLSEGLLLGAVGAVAGIIIALIFCYLQINFKLIKIPGDSFLIDYFPVKLAFEDFVLVAITASMIAFLASWFPAFKASGQPLNLR